MTATTKDVTIQMQSNLQPMLPRLRAIEGLEGRTELTRVGLAWRHAINNTDEEENDPLPPLEQQEAADALRDFRVAHDRRRRLAIPVMFLVGCSIGILAALAPHSRFFHGHASSPAATIAAVEAPAAAPISASPPPAAQTGLAMEPLDLDALMPTTSHAVATTTTVFGSSPPKHAHGSAPAPHAASSPASVAKAPASHAKTHAPAEDEDAVKNARAADDLAAAQLNDSL